MAKSILIVGSIFASLIFFGPDTLSQASEEKSEAITSTWYSTAKVLPLGEGRSFVIWEAFGVLISDEGKGLFHEATARTMGSQLMEKGISQNYGGHGCYFLKNGDKVFITFTAEIRPGIPTKGKTTIIGGTGKCSGIQGGWEYIGYPLRPAAEGTSQSYNKFNVKYKLP